MPTSAEGFKRRLGPIIERARELETRLGDPNLTQDPAQLKQLTRDYRRATALLTRLSEYEQIEKETRDTEAMLHETDDAEMHELTRIELTKLNKKLARLEAELKTALLPRSPDWDKNCIIEIRPAAGGEESALFTGNLFRMYSKFAERHHLKLEVMNSRPSELKGFKEMTFAVEGPEPYRFFRFESGVHRVQRVPETEASGRIHTSTVTVAVLPEPEEVELKIDSDDLRIDVFHSSGHGGQHVNVTDSAVRITHIPTGIVVTCQDERSQGRNKARAMKVLRARLLEAKRKEEHSRTAQTRRKQIGAGDRSEKIRTYNFPQNRVTDHRIGLSVYSLDTILGGNLDLVFDKLEQAEAEIAPTQNNES
ncbi:peptide chain release factor 1 [candidate division WOR-3 bacterium JGI_Cruoil_03_51_56]|uniref:Peptide chain release factor 1 n=1 Tax=candidate division WOR-3 bacterium JGI_Cruoil_03_51_56 TaxID=1973747 RepID=A0A235BUM0_UNCW3|nr:MAG: peptide chain release factor 1 [candidate division WOR-3 bacterium JGI_Cruoil_03_51_56]